MKKLQTIFITSFLLLLVIVPTTQAKSWSDMTSYQMQKFWQLWETDCQPLLMSQNWSEYMTCSQNAFETASNMEESKSWCKDSDGLDYFTKGIVTTDTNPEGITDYIYTFSDGSSYLFEGGCSDDGGHYVRYQKNCAELGAKYTTGDGVCVFKNNAPVIEVIGDKTVKEGELLTFIVKALDVDGDSLTYNTEGLPVGAKFDGGIFEWIPSFEQSGSYQMIFKISDGYAVSTQKTLIIVTDFHGWLTMSIEGAPPGTYWGSSVWTGEEMFVWGGMDVALNSSGNQQANAVNKGGLYNPKTNTWKPVNKVGAPSARQLPYNLVIWTGQEVVIWGGNNSGTIFNDGAKYNPKTDTWTSISMINAPQARTSHSTIWTGKEMVVWGGVGAPNGQIILNDGGRYNPVTDTWLPIILKDAPSKRAGHRAVWTGDKMIIWGGNISGNQPKPIIQFNDGGIYDPITDNWIPITSESAPIGQGTFTATWTGSEMITWGGWTVGGDSYALNDGWKFNPKTMQWIKINQINAPTSRYMNTAIWTGSKMIIFGGYNHKVDGSIKWFNDSYSYDFVKDVWEKLLQINAPEQRSHHESVWTGDMMIIWGGQNDGKSIDSGGRYIP